MESLKERTQVWRTGWRLALVTVVASAVVYALVSQLPTARLELLASFSFLALGLFVLAASQVRRSSRRRRDS